MASFVTPKKNAEYIFYISLVDQADVKLFKSSPTIAAGDFKVSTDGGALGNPATLPVVTPAASKSVKVTLSATEMNGDNIIFIASDAAGAEWSDFMVNIQTSARQIDDLAFPVVSGRGLAVNASNEVTADVTAISGDSAAADNLELMYDGTGYVADTAPSSRSQVDNIGAASGGAFAIEATEDNTSSPIKGVSSVGTPTGTFTNTEAEDGVYHVITHDTNDIDWIYGFDVGGSRSGVSVESALFLNSNNDAMSLQAFDFVGADWETIIPLPGQNGSTNISLSPSLLSKHTGTGADLGKVYLRFEADGAMTSPVLNVDLLHVLAVNIGQSVGYANGSIWVDTVNGVAGVEAFTNGTGDNPVLTWADALTLSASVGITDFHIINGSTVQLTASSDNFSLFGDNWTLDLNAQSISAVHVEGATVSGTGTGASRPTFKTCEIGTVNLVPFMAEDSGLNGTMTFSTAGDYELTNCHSSIAGVATPVIDTGAAVANVNLTMPNYQQGAEIRNLNATGSDLFSISGAGQIIYAASSSGTVHQRGDWKVTNTGGVTITEDDNTNNIGEIGTAGAGLTEVSLAATGLDAIVSTATGMVEIAKSVWDRVINKANHGIAQSSGKTLRDLATVVIRSDTAQGAGTGNNQIQFDTGASAVDGAYDPAAVSIIGGTGMGQTRNIFQYAGATKTATVDRDWKVNPDATSEFIISANAGREHVNEGLAQGSTATTLTLNTLADANDDTYAGQLIFIRSGLGQDQTRLILSYNGTTKVAILDSPWITNPDTTSAYALLPSSPMQLSTLTQATVDAILVDTGTTLPALINDLAIKKNTMFSNFEFLMVLTSDHVTPALGLTVTGRRSIDGGAFTAVSGSIAEVGNGIYQFDALSADTNGDFITWRFLSGTADDAFISFKTVA